MMEELDNINKNKNRKEAVKQEIQFISIKVGELTMTPS